MKKIIEKPQNLFLIICLLWGILFMLVNPPFQAPDEDSHLYKMYGITDGSFNFKKYTTDNINGNYLGQKLTFGGQILPIGLIQASRYNKRITGDPLKKTSIKETFEISNIQLNKNQKIFIGYPAPFYTVISYIPAIFFVFLLKLINATPFWMLYISRICSLITYSAFCYYTIKITPIKKWMFLALCLMPMCIYQSSAVSTDAISCGSIFLFIAYTLYLSFDEKIKEITKKQLLVFFGLIIFLSICKFTYFPLILMYFIIPKEKFPSSKIRYNSFFIFSVISAILCFLPIMYHMHTIEGVQAFSSNLDKKELIKFIFYHPIEYFTLISKTLLINFRYYLNGFVGLFGWIDTPIPYYAVWTYIYIILLTTLLNYNEKTIAFSIKNKILLFFAYILCLFLIFTSCYLTFLPDDFTHTIGGIQGRYFIPVAPIFFLLFYNNKFQFKTKLFEWLIIVLINFVLFISLIRLIYRFYI